MGFRRAHDGAIDLIVTIMIVAGTMISCATPGTGADGTTEIEASMLFAKPGFVVLEEGGRLWIFREGSAELALFQEPAKQVVRPKAGPDGVTLKSTESATIDEYLTTLPGYYTQMEDGRLWVFRVDSPALEEFLKTGEASKNAVRPLAGPFGLTLQSVDTELINEYMAAWEDAAG